MADIIHSGQVSNTDDRRHEIQIYNNTNTQLQIHITTNTLVQIHITTNTQLQIHITTNTLVQIPNCEYTNTNIIPQVRCPTRDSLLAAGFIRLPFTRSRLFHQSFMGDILWGQFRDNNSILQRFRETVEILWRFELISAEFARGYCDWLPGTRFPIPTVHPLWEMHAIFNAPFRNAIS